MGRVHDGCVAAVLVAVVVAGCSSDRQSDPADLAPVTTAAAQSTADAVAGTTTVAEASADDRRGDDGSAATASDRTTTEAPDHDATADERPRRADHRGADHDHHRRPSRCITEGGVVIVANASGIDGAAAALTEHARRARLPDGEGDQRRPATRAPGRHARCTSPATTLPAGLLDRPAARRRRRGRRCPRHRRSSTRSRACAAPTSSSCSAATWPARSRPVPGGTTTSRPPIA